MSSDRYIRIFDTTLRDGEQAPGATLNKAEKLEIAQQLARLKVDIIEAGFPIASPDDFDAVQSIASEVKGPRIAGLARAIEQDIRTCWDAVRVAEVPRIHTFISTSPVHMQYQIKKTPDEVLADTRAMVTLRPSWRGCSTWPCSAGPPPSTCPIRWATRCRSSSATSSASSTGWRRRSMTCT